MYLLSTVRINETDNNKVDTMKHGTNEGDILVELLSLSPRESRLLSWSSPLFSSWDTGEKERKKNDPTMRWTDWRGKSPIHKLLGENLLRLVKRDQPFQAGL